MTGVDDRLIVGVGWKSKFVFSPPRSGTSEVEWGAIGAGGAVTS